MATVSTVTPTDPTQNTKVTYVKKDAALTVLFLDKTTGTTLATVKSTVSTATKSSSHRPS
ncbi:hypothetical protein IAL74_04245 [Limosilactobacillus fermentum]|uniref:hypothetical protein n=1 Tax=Limosilactobacillus fermentum TaxID=1613 RepID=UPI001881A2DD|nr:hypothetical protein [Limosilactobacillus fermentum]MBE8118141.1 hypothetical protein [Limosilactobacillus fermentum]